MISTWEIQLYLPVLLGPVVMTVLFVFVIVKVIQWIKP